MNDTIVTTQINKSFLINNSQLEGRLDPEYYRPEIMALEEKVRSKSTKRLRHYIERVASGATPSIKEEGKFYSDAENGIPFLRVQNLQTNCKLSLGNVRYINSDTHENMLRRSQVSENDLLVKITGVGRMAIASIAPSGFVGNTNQHMVVIKTQDSDTSEYLANYLNLDIAEKLASRRSTGGTRPALDYPALKSIPIIEGIDFTAIKDAEKQKQEKDAEAKTLLDSIDGYLLEELGVIIPKKKSSLNDRMFFSNLKSVSGKRLDPLFSTCNIDKYGVKYPMSTIGSIAYSLQSGFGAGKDDQTDIDGVVHIRPTNINLNGEIIYDKNVYVPRTETKLKLSLGDVLFNNTNSQELVGKTAVLCEDRELYFSNHITRIKVNSSILPIYLSLILNLYQKNKIFFSTCTNWNNQSGIGIDLLRSIKIPIPSTKKQTEITNNISEVRTKAKQLQQEGKYILAEAKREVEKIIIG